MMKITGDIDATFDRMEVVIPDIEKKVLDTGAFYLKERVKDALIEKMPAATRPVRNETVTRGYKITTGESLVDAVRQSKFKYNKVKVHILGAGTKSSPLFITRFYEDGTFKTSPRYQKTYKGKKLKKKKDLGSITGLHFFKTTIDMFIDRANDLMGKVYEGQINKIFG